MTEDASAQKLLRAARWLYTNGPAHFDDVEARMPLFFHLHMDTWYWSEIEMDGRDALVGNLDYGEGPLTPEQGVSAFLVEHLRGFRDHFAGVLRPRQISLDLDPQLTGVESHRHSFALLEGAEGLQELQRAIDRAVAGPPGGFGPSPAGRSGASYEGITGMSIACDLLAAVRDEQGEYHDLWLPWASYAWYSAHGYRGASLPDSPGVVAVYPLTPLGEGGHAAWSVKLGCDFLSLFRPNNTETLERVRTFWRTWLLTHPSSAVSKDDERTLTWQGEAERQPHEAYFITLADPPDGTPRDNHDLYERNWSRLQAAVQRWEHWMQRPFEWTM